MQPVLQCFMLHVMCCTVLSSGAPLTNFNDGGIRQRFIFYTQKYHNFRICLPKKITTFFSIPPKNTLAPFRNLNKSLCFFFRDPKKSQRLSETQKNHFGQNFRPKKITRTLPSLKYVSRAPGVLSHANLCCVFKALICATEGLCSIIELHCIPSNYITHP